MLENEHGILKVPISNGINENFCRVYRKCGRYTFFSLALCVVCFFFVVHPLRFIESLNAVYSEIYKTKTLYTKAQICRRYFRARKKNSNIPSDIQLWLFQLQTEIKMFDAKRKCRRHMEWAEREEEKKIVRAPKNNVIISNAYASFLKAKPFICHSTFIP